MTSTASDGSILTNITVEVNDTEASISLTESGLDLINDMYTFTVVANSLAGPGETSTASIDADSDYLGESTA